MYYFFLCPCQTSQECRGCTKRCRCHAVQTPLDKLRMSCLYPSYRRISLINSPCMLWHSSCKVVSSLVRTENTVTIPQLADTLQARSRHKIVGHSPEPASQASNLCTCHTLSGLGTCPGGSPCSRLVRPGLGTCPKDSPCSRLVRSRLGTCPEDSPRNTGTSYGTCSCTLRVKNCSTPHARRRQDGG